MFKNVTHSNYIKSFNKALNKSKFSEIYNILYITI